MPNKTKKILKVLARVACLEAIVDLAVAAVLIFGIIHITATAGSLPLAILACILYVSAVIFIVWKLAKKVTNFFEQNE